jgi:TIR domain
MAEAALKPGVIFVSYRRTDAGWPADLVATELKRRFGQARVFQDVRDIDSGDDFGAVLEEQFRQTSVLLALIGGGWLRAQDKFGRRRLDQTDDWVRREIKEALEKPGCVVIPVLLDDATLPDEEEALPPDISNFLKRQRFTIRQARSVDDIEALSRHIEDIGFTRISRPAPTVPGAREFSDEEVDDVATRLRQLREQRGVEFLDRRELFSELDLLFNRKTFRFEALRGCPEQRWADRLDSAYQTLEVLRGCTRNVQRTAADRYPTYRDLVKEVDVYCMQMGSLLFKEPVDYDRIKDHIRKVTFKAQLPAPIRFPAPEPHRQPVIPDEINDKIEPHRERAVELMDELTRE